MKKKELKNLAKKIAECEYIIQTSQDDYDKEQAKNDIFKLTNGIHSFEDLDLMDEMVQEFLAKKLAE